MKAPNAINLVGLEGDRARAGRPSVASSSGAYKIPWFMYQHLSKRTFPRSGCYCDLGDSMLTRTRPAGLHPC